MSQPIRFEDAQGHVLRGYANDGESMEFVFIEHPAPGGGVFREGIWRTVAPAEPETAPADPETADNGE